MANEEFFENYLRRGKNYDRYNGGLEFYEDTHDANGNYIPSNPQNFGTPQNNGNNYASPNNNYNNGYAQQAATNNYAPQNNNYAQPQNNYDRPAGNNYAQQQNNYNNPAQSPVRQNGVEYTSAPSASDYAGGQNNAAAPNAQQPAPQDDQPKAQDLPTYEQFIGNKLNQKFALYNPRSLADVERLIAYLRRMEPALVDFDAISDKPDAQRFMDFISGAAFALGYSLISTRRNQFLIMPDTMDVLKSEDDD